MAHATSDLVVDSVTGVDVSLAVAGTGARALAFLVDLLIRAVLMLSWYVVATLIYNGGWSLAAPLEPDVAWYVGVALPSTGIYFLYHCVLEIAMRGRTPGKRMVGVRLVTRSGAIPSAAALLVRNVFRLVDSFPAFYGVGLVTSMLSRDHVRVGDFAAGTLLVYENRSAFETAHLRLSANGKRLDVATSELIGELLERWNTLDLHVRDRLARSLLKRAMGVAADESADDAVLRQQLERIASNTSAGMATSNASTGTAK